LAGREPEITGKVPPGPKALHVAYRGHQGRGGQEADPGNCTELADAQRLRGGGLELLLDGANARFDLTDLLQRDRQGRPEQSGHAGVGLLQQRSGLGHPVVRPAGRGPGRGVLGAAPSRTPPSEPAPPLAPPGTAGTARATVAGDPAPDRAARRWPPQTPTSPRRSRSSYYSSQLLLPRAQLATK